MVDWQHYRKECRRKKGKEKIKKDPDKGEEERGLKRTHGSRMKEGREARMEAQKRAVVVTLRSQFSVCPKIAKLRHILRPNPSKFVQGSDERHR
jgi:hypothetical protein